MILYCLLGIWLLLGFANWFMVVKDGGTITLEDVLMLVPVILCGPVGLVFELVERKGRNFVIYRFND